MIRITGVTAVALVLVLSGCGGGAPEDHKQVEKACKIVRDALTAASTSSDTDGTAVRERLRTSLTRAERLVTKASSANSEWKSLGSQLHTANDLLKQINAADAADPSKIDRTLVQQLGVAGSALQDECKKVGVK